MTAINIIRQSRAVHVLTDGAAYKADGTLHVRVQKAFPFLHLNAAMAWRGSPLLAPIFAVHASVKATSFDHLRSIARNTAITALSETQDAIKALGGDVEFDMAIAGWSETSGPSSYFLCNHGRHGGGVSAWEVIDLGPVSLAPTSDAINAELAGAYPNGANPDQLDPVIDGLRILEIQRKHPVDHAGDFGTVRAVGGFAQLTTIKLGAIDMRIIRRWPEMLRAQ
jgi:hypothetical protein